VKFRLSLPEIVADLPDTETSTPRG
jgi:hypothetical protein